MIRVDRIPSLGMTAELSWHTAGPAALPIRTANPQDIDPLADVLVRAYTGTPYDHGKSREDVLSYLKGIVEDEVRPMLLRCSFVAVDAERPVAVVLTCKENGKGLLQDVATAPEYQRRGLATALITRAMNALAESGYARIRLRVAAANHRARRIYERLGFVPE